MTVNTTPIYTLTPNDKAVAIPATADTSLTAPSNVTKVLTGGTDGTLVDGIWFQATGTTTAGMLRVFQRIADAGSYLLIGEVVVYAATPSATVAAFVGVWRPAISKSSLNIPWLLPATDCLYITTHNAEAFTAIPAAGNF
jgi:hypothetical protein